MTNWLGLGVRIWTQSLHMKTESHHTSQILKRWLLSNFSQCSWVFRPCATYTMTWSNVSCPVDLQIGHKYKKTGISLEWQDSASHRTPAGDEELLNCWLIGQMACQTPEQPGQTLHKANVVTKLTAEWNIRKRMSVCVTFLVVSGYPPLAALLSN